MLPRARKYALDTSVFIIAFRNATRKNELQVFRRAYAPHEYLSAVVVQELRAGAQSNEASLRLQRHVLEPLERRRRVFTPTYAAWKRAGEALARLATLEDAPLRSFGRTFVNDALLASSCREAGIALITNNVGDFVRLQRVMAFELVPVWTDT